MPNRVTLQAVFTPEDARRLAKIALGHEAAQAHARVIDLAAERAARR